MVRILHWWSQTGKKIVGSSKQNSKDPYSSKLYKANSALKNLLWSYPPYFVLELCT